MTKLKSKKMSKSTFAIIIMAIAMVAMLAFGGTYAYFTSEAAGIASGTETVMARIELDATNDTLSAESLVDNVLPGEPIFASNAKFGIKDSSNRASHIFIVISAKINKATGHTEAGVANAWDSEDEILALTGTVASSVGTINPLSGKTGVYYITTTEGTDGTVGSTFDISGIQALLDLNTYGNPYQQAKITLTVTVKSIQTVGFTDPANAYSALFPENNA